MCDLEGKADPCPKGRFVSVGQPQGLLWLIRALLGTCFYWGLVVLFGRFLQNLLNAASLVSHSIGYGCTSVHFGISLQHAGVERKLGVRASLPPVTARPGHTARQLFGWAHTVPRQPFGLLFCRLCTAGASPALCRGAEPSCCASERLLVLGLHPPSQQGRGRHC